MEYMFIALDREAKLFDEAWGLWQKFLPEDAKVVESFKNAEAGFKQVSDILIYEAESFDDLKIIANKNDVPYQSLIKVILAERIQTERSL